MDYTAMKELYTSRALIAMDKLQSIIPNYNNFIKDLPFKYNQLSELLKSPLIQNYKNTQALFGNISNFESTLNAIENAVTIKNSMLQSYNYHDKYKELSNLLRSSNALFTAIEEKNIVYNSFVNSGIFDAISNMSKIMPALQAVKRLDVLFPLIKNIDYQVSFSGDNDITVNDETLTKAEVLEIAQEFKSIPLDKSITQQDIEKVNSKKGKFFISILFFILYHLCLSPKVEEIFSVAREYLGINILLEKIDIKNWVDEFMNNKTEEIKNEKEE